MPVYSPQALLKMFAGNGQARQRPEPYEKMNWEVTNYA
mgnify:FL=1